MSMDSEAIRAAISEEVEEKQVIEDLKKEFAGVGDDAGRGSLNFDFSFLRAKTGEGDISEYLNHALNFNKSKGVAQMLRGFTGLLGELNLAVIDITLGAFQFAKEKSGSVAVDGTKDFIR